MLSTTNSLNGRRDPGGAMRCRLAALALVVVAACGGMDTAGSDDARAPCVPPAAGTAPTYTELYTKYFAANTKGHCATAGCHLDGSQGWTCGLTKNTCYQGMVAIQLIDPTTPTASVIADPKSSPLSWINPNGPMPQDTPGSFPEGATAIAKWAAACAQNN
jgi:hypothetical protein